MKYLKLSLLAGLFIALAFQVSAQTQLRSETFSSVATYSSNLKANAVTASFQFYANNKELHLANTSSGPVIALNWNFGDGYTSSESNFPVHRFKTPGIYNVCLTVMSATDSDTSCQLVSIQ